MFLHADKTDSDQTEWMHRSDLADTQAYQSLCSVHISVCWFCHEAAQLIIEFRTGFCCAVAQYA